MNWCIFEVFFNEEFWRTIPAIVSVIDACNQLHDAGFELVCISAIDSKFENARLENLRNLGFPIQRVIATSSSDDEMNPKAAALNLLNPIAFVDDYLPYHRCVPLGIHRTLITRETNGTPNFGAELGNIDSSHEDLFTFSVLVK